MARMDYILGAAILGHDLSLTVVDGEGEVVFVAEEERYSRIKGGRFVFHPDLAVNVLAECGIDPAAVGTLAIAGDPTAWTTDDERLLSFSAEARARHLAAWLTAFRARLPNVNAIQYLRHHRAHAASAFFASPWDEAAVVTLDGFGDGEVATISHGRGVSLTLLESQPFPHSLPYLYRAIATWLGLEGHEREGKLMALAAYGRPVEQQRLRQLLSAGDNGPWRLAPVFLNVECKSGVWTQVLERLLGPGRRPEDPIEAWHYNIAASIQALFETELLALLRRARALTRTSHCCCAGGAFLNCAANGVLQRSGIFEVFFFQPLAADSGLSLGAALHAARALGRGAWRMEHLRLGSALDIENLPTVARQLGIRIEHATDVVDVAARQLAAGSIVGWCQGRMEAGPRGLGGRSLLADPRRREMVDRLNRIKGRELWRPFAPIVLEDETATLFGRVIRSPHMNVAFSVLNPETIPAAVHIDGTARLQTVADSDDPLTSRLLRRFRELTGLGALVNTSLNLRGQPLVRAVKDCVAFFCESEIDVLVLDDFIVERNNTARPLTLHQPHKWSGLPPRFVLAALDPDGSLRPWINDLQDSATDFLQLAVDASFEIHLSEEVLKSTYGQNLVFLLPGYVEVCVETLPRALAWALRVRPRFAGMWLADLSGKVIPSSAALEGLDAGALDARPLSDVEVHYLRNRARSGAT